MNDQMIRLFKWFDRKTSGLLWSTLFAERLVKETDVPKCMREAFKAYKKCNKARRAKLALEFIG